MPGTIQVSVLDLMDMLSPSSSSPSEANTSLLSLKVAMGKREYQTKDKGDFSFPVMSLRENLIVMLQDEEGSELSRTEIKTISVVERGFWDDFFPLEGGGRVHLKLQFSLSEEEHKRIREMRESALKRKRGELLKGDSKSSVLGEKIGGSTELITERTLVDRLEQKDPGECRNPLGTPPLQAIEERSEHSVEHDIPHMTEPDKETRKIQSPSDGVQEKHISSREGLNPQLGLLGSLNSGEITEDNNSISYELEEDQTHNPKKRNLLEKSLRSNVRKMISAFENSPSQGLQPRVLPRTKSQVRKTEIEDSLKRTCSEESDISDIKNVKLPQAMVKSFSAEMLSEMSSQQVPKLFKSLYAKRQEEVQHSDRSTKRETIAKSNQFVDFKNNQNFKNLGSGKQKAVKVTDDERSYEESPHDAGSHSSKGTNDVPKPIKNEEVASLGESAEHVSEREDLVSFIVKESSSIMSTQGKFNTPKEEILLDAFPKAADIIPLSHSDEELEVIGAKNNPSAKTYPSGDRTYRENGTRERSGANYLQPFHEVSLKVVHEGENRKEEQGFTDEAQLSRAMVDGSIDIDQPCSLCTYQEWPVLNAFVEESQLRSCRSDSGEQTKCGTSTYSDTERCPFGSLGSWIPRHLCITTSSKQLRDLVECYHICAGTHPTETNLSGMGAIEKQKVSDDTSIEVNKDEKISFSSDHLNLGSSKSISKMNSGLIGQGVRIAIIIVACGTLILNTRQRKARFLLDSGMPFYLYTSRVEACSVLCRVIYLQYDLLHYMVKPSINN